MLGIYGHHMHCAQTLLSSHQLQFIIISKFATGMYHSTRSRNPWLNLFRSNSEFQSNTFQYFYISVAHKYLNIDFRVF